VATLKDVEGKLNKLREKYAKLVTMYNENEKKHGKKIVTQRHLDKPLEIPGPFKTLKVNVGNVKIHGPFKDKDWETKVFDKSGNRETRKKYKGLGRITFDFKPSDGSKKTIIIEFYGFHHLWVRSATSEDEINAKPFKAYGNKHSSKNSRKHAKEEDGTIKLNNFSFKIIENGIWVVKSFYTNSWKFEFSEKGVYSNFEFTAPEEFLTGKKSGYGSVSKVTVEGVRVPILLRENFEETK
jgi:hypothetical protein